MDALEPTLDVKTEEQSKAFSPCTLQEFRLTLKQTDAGDIWIEIHFTSASRFSFRQILYSRGEHKLLHFAPPKTFMTVESVI